MRTVPVKYSAFPLVEGCAPALLMSIQRSLQDYSYLLTICAYRAHHLEGCLAIDHPLRAFRVPLSLDRNLRCGAFNFAEISLAKLDRGPGDVLLQAMQFCCPRDRNDPR